MSFLLNEMGLDKMGLDEMGWHRLITQTHSQSSRTGTISQKHSSDNYKNYQLTSVQIGSDLYYSSFKVVHWEEISLLLASLRNGEGTSRSSLIPRPIWTGLGMRLIKARSAVKHSQLLGLVVPRSCAIQVYQLLCVWFVDSSNWSVSPTMHLWWNTTTLSFHCWLYKHNYVHTPAYKAIAAACMWLVGQQRL